MSVLEPKPITVYEYDLSSEKQYARAADLPGSSCGIAVSHHVYMKSEYRNKGHGVEEARRRLRILSEALYDYVLCTVADDNKKQIHILTKTGWKRLDTFHHTSTDTLVHLYGRHLGENNNVQT